MTIPLSSNLESSQRSLKRFGRYYQNIEPLFAQPKIIAMTMLVLSLLAISFFGFFAIKPTLSTITSLQKQIKDAQMVDKKLQEKINALSAAQIAYEKIKPDLFLLDLALPQEPKFSAFIKTLEKLASDNKITINALSFQSLPFTANEATAASKLKSQEIKESPIIFNITVNGDYLSLTSFIKQLTNNERLATIEKMGFLNKEKTKDKKELILTITGKTYYVEN